MTDYHKSVLLQEAVAYLHVKPGDKYIDATLGGGGHTQRILEGGGIVLGIDIDKEALQYVAQKFKNLNSKFNIGKELFLAQGNFKDIVQIAHEHGFNHVVGILFDIGVSSYQFDTAERGFSFQKDALLDMRMSDDLTVTAADLVNALSKDELTELFKTYGEEHYASKIAQVIVQSRKIKKIKTTTELAEIIAREYPSHPLKRRIHPATKVFQALRIAVNDELNNLREALPKALDLLESKGRLVVISFQSLEDRIVKTAFAEFEKEQKGVQVTKKPIESHYEEVTDNKRSRSAKMRVFEKI